MSSDYRPNRRRLTPGARFLLSAVSVCFLLFLSGFAFRYCLSLFVVGDEYLIHRPGRESLFYSVMTDMQSGLQNTIDGIYYTPWPGGMQAVLCRSAQGTEKLSCTYGQTSADVLF